MRIHRSAHLICDLIEVGLDQAPDYEAVSYEWGKKPPDSQILVKGEQVTIRRNLWEALRVFGKETNKHRLLWIDAICINQSDDQERNSQVAMMGRIYAEALSVLAWTGSERYHDRFAMLGLKMILAKQVPRLSSAKALQHIYVHEFANWLFRSYWSRLWIVQECVLAKKLYVYSGSTPVFWPVLHNALELYPPQGREYLSIRTGAVRFLDTLNHVDGPLHACQDAVTVVHARLVSLPKHVVFGKVVDKTTERALKTLSELKPILELALHADQRTITLSIEKFVKDMRLELFELRLEHTAEIQYQRQKQLEQQRQQVLD